MNAVDFLATQHRVARFLADRLKASHDPIARADLRGRLVATLRGHVAMEKELVLPRLGRDDESRELMDASLRGLAQLDESLCELGERDLHDAELLAIVDEIVDCLAEHAILAEEELLPRVARVCPPGELDRLGAYMQRRVAGVRRGLTKPRPAP